jgi:hypothetical protein
MDVFHAVHGFDGLNGLVNHIGLLGRKLAFLNHLLGGHFASESNGFSRGLFAQSRHNLPHIGGYSDDLVLLVERLAESVFDPAAGIGRETVTQFWVEFLNGTKTPKTLKEIGTKINLTKERVRQIEKEALSELRQRILGSTQSSPTHSRPQHYTQLEISAA